jgi:hypothetical protein
MPTYTFLLFRSDGSADTLDAVDFDYDGATFLRAGQLLTAHRSCDYVEVWDGDRAVLARHREQPIIRPVRSPPPTAFSTRARDELDGVVCEGVRKAADSPSAAMARRREASKLASRGDEDAFNQQR